MKRLQRKIPQVNWPSGKCKCKSQADATLTMHQNGLKKEKRKQKIQVWAREEVLLVRI